MDPFEQLLLLSGAGPKLFAPSYYLSLFKTRWWYNGSIVATDPGSIPSQRHFFCVCVCLRELFHGTAAALYFYKYRSI